MKEAPKSIDVTFNRRNLILYALGIGSSELKFTYEDSADFSAFPTFFIVLQFAAGQNDVVGFPSPAMMAGVAIRPPVIELAIRISVASACPVRSPIGTAEVQSVPVQR